MNSRPILTGFAVIAAFATPIAASASTRAPQFAKPSASAACHGLKGTKLHSCVAKLKSSSPTTTTTK